MKLCNETVTVFNKKLDTTNGWDVYNATVIRGVSWYCEIASVVDGNGLHAANKFTIRIPADANFGGKTYVDPITYANETIVSGVFTLANGDIIVKAEAVNNSMTVAQIAALTPAKLKELYPDFCTILGVTDNRRAPNAPHFKVVGS